MQYCIARVRKGVYGVCLYVSELDIKKKGILVPKAGTYVFRGYWYGNNPFSIDSYGKIEGEAKNFKKVGKIRNHWQVKKLL